MGRPLRALIALVLVLAAACRDEAPAPSSGQPGLLAALAGELLDDAHAIGPAHELLVDHRRQIEEAVIAAGVTLDADVQRIARQITKDRLVPAIETLRAHGRWVLERQPRARGLELEGWSGTGQAFVGAALGEASALAKAPASEDERLDRIERGWNPVTVAWTVDREVVPDAEPWRWALDELAPPDIVVVGDDRDAPTIVLDRAHEIAIVRLKWDTGGFFQPVGYERYVRTPLHGADPSIRAPQGDLAAGQGPAYTLVVDFHRAVQLAVATETLSADGDKRVREIALRLAEERLLPHAERLHAHAHWTMRRWLPCAPDGDWTPAAPPTSASELTAIVEQGIEDVPEPQRRAARLLRAWEPLDLASSLQFGIHVRQRDRDGGDMSLFLALQRYARPQWVLVEGGLDAPAIGFEGARERLVVRLRWDPQGYYVPVEALAQRRARAP
jgi:hypothetical protein